MGFISKLVLGGALILCGVLLLLALFVGSAWMSLPNAPKGSAAKMLAWGVGLIAAGIAVLVIP